MRNLKNGKQIENRFRSGEEIQIERLESKYYQFLYKDTDEYYFMDNETYDQTHISGELIGDQGEFIKEGQTFQIFFHNGNPLSIEIPPHIEVKVISAPPAVKGNTATGATKPVTVETGSQINVPLFIEEGNIIKIDTRTREYIERVKN
jgi:elongation factor P